ncbi:myeloid lymphoid or mixed-lineage leukemia 5 (trithorax, ) [Tulasnella sp. JGI-2019a]|nr:myeloid lymphoid or mixed-lineage leukemia 5 (trithorax, ) [Tulasnella sp. JGI-2019a]
MNPNHQASSSSSALPHPPSASALDTGRIRCICTYIEDDGDTIFCEGCGYWQHLSCLGLTNMDKDDLPDKWFCPNCKPDQFEWVQSANGATGSTLASSLGIYPSHWKTEYLVSQKGVGLGLEIVPNPNATTAINQPYTVRSASSSLRISNLLSPAPGSSATNAPFPATPPPKILLDPAKAKKRQQERQLEDARMKKHQGAAGASGGGVGGDPIGSRNSNVVNGVGGQAAHGRKGSVAVASEGSKGKGKKAAPGATTGVAGSLKATSALPDTAVAGPSSANGSLAINASATPSSKRKGSSAISSVKPKAKDKDKDGASKWTPVPDTTTPRLHVYSTLPSVSTTPQGPYTTPYVPGQSPLYQQQPGSYPIPRSPSAVHSSSGAGAYGRNGGLGSGYQVVSVQTSGDYFSGALPPNGKGKDRERVDDPFYPMAGTPGMPPDGFSTQPPTPYYSHHTPLEAHHHLQHLAIPTTSTTPTSPLRYAPPSDREQQQPPPPLRSTHHSMLKFGIGSQIAVPRGASTGSEVTRPRPLVIRSFPRLPVLDDESAGRGGISLFLDPTIVPNVCVSSPVFVKDAPLRLASQPNNSNSDALCEVYCPPSAPVNPSPRTSSLSLPTPSVPSLSPSSQQPAQPSHGPFDRLRPNTPSHIITRETSSPPRSAVWRPNAVVRPLLCHKDLSNSNGGVTFGVFTLRALVPGESIVLGWEKVGLSDDSGDHDIHSRTHVLSYIGDTFTTCGACGRKARDCVEGVLASMKEEVTDQDGDDGEGEGVKETVGGENEPTAAKRDRSDMESEASVELAAAARAGSEDGRRASKRIKLSNGASAPVFHSPRVNVVVIPATPSPQVQVQVQAPSTPTPEESKEDTTIGQDLSLRRLQAEPGMPLQPSPRRTHRANWVSQLKNSQAQQKEVLARVSAPTIEPTSLPTRVAVVPSHSISTSSTPNLAIPSTSFSKPRTPAVDRAQRLNSTPSSPLTEQSESVNEDVDEDMVFEAPAIRSPQFGANGRREGSRRPSKVRIQSTPPSDTDGDGGGHNNGTVSEADTAKSPSRMEAPVYASSVLGRSTISGPAVVLHPPSASSDKAAELPAISAPVILPPHQRGPPKLRRWFTKQAAPPAPPASPPPLLIQPTTSIVPPCDPPASPVPSEQSKPKDVDSGSKALNDVIPAAKAPSTNSAMSFSINNLLNPAPERRARMIPDPVILAQTAVPSPVEVVVMKPVDPSADAIAPDFANSPSRQRSLSPIRPAQPRAPSPPVQDILQPIQPPSTPSPHPSSPKLLLTQEIEESSSPKVAPPVDQAPDDEDVIMDQETCLSLPLEDDRPEAAVSPIPAPDGIEQPEDATSEMAIDAPRVSDEVVIPDDVVMQVITPPEGSSAHRERRISQSSNEEEEVSVNGGDTDQRRGSSPLSSLPSDLTEDPGSAAQHEDSSMSPTTVARSAPIESVDSAKTMQDGDITPITRDVERSPSVSREVPLESAEESNLEALAAPPSPTISVHVPDPVVDLTVPVVSVSEPTLPDPQPNGLPPPHSPSLTSLSIDALTPPVEPGSPQTAVRKTLTFKEAFQARRLKAQQEKEKALERSLSIEPVTTPAVEEPRAASEVPNTGESDVHASSPAVEPPATVVEEMEKKVEATGEEAENVVSTEGTQDVTAPEPALVMDTEESRQSVEPTVPEANLEKDTPSQKTPLRPLDVEHHMNGTPPSMAHTESSLRTPPKTPPRTPPTRLPKESSSSEQNSKDFANGASGLSASASPRPMLSPDPQDPVTVPKPPHVAKAGRTRFSAAFADLPSLLLPNPSPPALGPPAKLSSPTSDHDGAQHSRTTTSTDEDKTSVTLAAAEKRKLRDRISDFAVVTTPLEESVAQKLGLAIVDSVREQNRFQTSPVAKKPPTEPRHARGVHVPPLNMIGVGATEEGEITSPMASPGPSGSQNGRSAAGSGQTNVPTQPRSQRAPSIAASGRSSPPLVAGRPPAVLLRAPPTQPRNNILPSAPRALREGPGPPTPLRGGGSRLGGPSSFRDGERERERTWERDQDRSRDDWPRDGRDRDWRRDRDREPYSRRGRGGGRGR